MVINRKDSEHRQGEVMEVEGHTVFKEYLGIYVLRVNFNPR